MIKKTGEKTTSSIYSHRHCVMCGRQNPLSLGLQFTKEEDGAVTAEFTGSRLLQGYSGILHGGVLSALLDTAMAHCLVHHGIEGMTGELNVRFLAPVPYNAPLFIRAWLVDSLPPLYRLKAEIVIEEKVVCRAKSKFMQRC